MYFAAHFSKTLQSWLSSKDKVFFSKVDLLTYIIVKGSFIIRLCVVVYRLIK